MNCIRIRHPLSSWNVSSEELEVSHHAREFTGDWGKLSRTPSQSSLLQTPGSSKQVRIMFGVVIESTPDGAPAQPTSRRHRHSHTPEMASTDIKDTHTAYASQTFDSRRYWTSRDWRTSARLRLQHYLVQQQIKWLTHPSIPRPQPGDNYRVLDIGCGNAAWLTDLSPELPSANLVGIDISASLFPFQSLRPGNVILHTFDIFNDNFPPGFRNSFDLINARALACSPNSFQPSASAI